MSIQGLQTPFERLAALPTTMNWRGTWLNTETYFQNDVVVSPLSTAAYILPNETTHRGGVDPALSPLWAELSPLSTGIQSITSGNAGIAVDNTDPQQPIVSNTGVLTIGAGTGIEVDNTDPLNPVVSSTAVSQVQAGNGILIGGTQQLPLITNTGVLQLNQGDGISLTAQTGTIGISNTGVIQIIPGGGIDVGTDPNFVTLTNTGVTNFTALGSGLIQGGTAQSPTVTNNGVLSVAAGDATIIVNNTDPHNPIISSSAPQFSQIVSVAFPFSATGTYPPNTAMIIEVITSRAIPSPFTTYLLNGAPSPLGIFMIDLTQFMLNFTASPGGSPNVIQNQYSITFVDATTAGGPYSYTSATILNNQYLVAGSLYTNGQSLGINPPLGYVYFNVADARTAGMRQLDALRVLNSTNGTMNMLSYVQGINGVYYPAGLE